MAPPKVLDNIIQFLANSVKDFEAQKGIQGDKLKKNEIRVVLPAWESIFAFHPCNLEVNLSTKKWKSATLFPLNLKSRPY